MALWLSALVPAPACWTVFLLFSTYIAIHRAYQWASRGNEEWLAQLYGGGDREIIQLSRRWTRSITLWSAVDALVFLGLWHLNGQIPLWAVFLGLPCYVMGAVISPRLLAFILPPRVLSTILGLGYILIFILLIMHKQIPPDLIKSGFDFLGVLLPSGWGIVLIHDLLEGRTLIAGTAAFLLALSAVALRYISPGQVERLMQIGKLQEPPLPEDFKNNEEDQVSKSASGETTARDAINKELSAIRTHSTPDFPPRFQMASRWVSRGCWTIGIILLLALNVHFGILLSKTTAAVLLGVSLVIMQAFWIPITGKPAWLNLYYISQNRVAAIFVLFPVSFRRQLISLIKNDLRKACLALPFLIITSICALILAIPEKPFSGISSGLAIPLLFLLQLPLVWLFHVSRPLSNKPFGFLNIFKGCLFTIICLVFCVEIFSACTFIMMMCRPGQTADYLFSLFTLVPALLNVGVSLLGITLFLSAYEKLKVDVVKPPPRS